MKLSLAEPKYLKDSITIISDLVNEARFKITKHGIELVAMDPANVAMVIFKLLSSSFVEYDVKKEMEIAINLTNLKQILRRVGTTDTITLEAGEGNKLTIILQGTSKRTFQIPIIELEEKEQRIPDLDFPVEIRTSSAILNECIEDADTVAESVNFAVEKGKFTILAEGDLNKAKIEIEAGENTTIKLVGSEEVIRAKYSIEYLKKMIAGSKLASEAVLRFNKDYPLKLEYISKDRLMLSFILAPRVEND